MKNNINPLTYPPSLILRIECLYPFTHVICVYGICWIFYFVDGNSEFRDSAGSLIVGNDIYFNNVYIQKILIANKSEKTIEQLYREAFHI